MILLKIQFCNHIASYLFLSDLILDTARGQYQCPLCKKLSNLLLPVTQTSRDLCGLCSPRAQQPAASHWVSWVSEPILNR